VLVSSSDTKFGKQSSLNRGGSTLAILPVDITDGKSGDVHEITRFGLSGCLQGDCTGSSSLEFIFSKL
jgi:hypothetical protein